MDEMMMVCIRSAYNCAIGPRFINVVPIPQICSFVLDVMRTRFTCLASLASNRL
jgi:hypothetical protein